MAMGKAKRTPVHSLDNVQSAEANRPSPDMNQSLALNLPAEAEKFRDEEVLRFFVRERR